ncbi:DUF4190 domain-containing protein [Microbacterium sp. LMI1x-1-1.1]|uniref:DUF4190 domain-containing protein n=1 Tax=Microbacterium sp. LMI1x-1-1.1 TaxID=3135246 RepID=UPI003428BC5D
MTDATNTSPQHPDVPPTPPAPDASSPAAPPYAPPAYPQASPYGHPQPTAAPAYGQPQYQGQQYQGQPYGQPAYGQPGYGYAVAPARPTNVLAIISLVASIVGLTIIPFLASIPGIITGHMALKQLKTSGENGRGMALWGTILGWIGAGFWLLLLVIWLVVVIGLAATASSVGQYS